MQWTEAVDDHIKQLQPVAINPVLLQQLFSVIDLTSLNDNDSEDDMINLFAKTQSPLGYVSAVCIPQRFVRLAVTQFSGTPVKVATVANFPEGSSSLEDVLIEINQALQNGAQEIDVVFPYARYLAGERQYTHNFITACKAACGASATLKVILETGALLDLAIIADACYEVIASGADFVKTSTGKISQGATLEAAAVMLLVIKHMREQVKHEVGIKVSGGIREIQQAAQYMQLAEQIMGQKWLTPDTFRIGASQLVNELIKA